MIFWSNHYRQKRKKTLIQEVSAISHYAISTGSVPVLWVPIHLASYKAKGGSCTKGEIKFMEKKNITYKV